MSVQIAYAVTAIVLLAAGHISGPPTHLRQPLAIAAGLVLAGLLYALLARGSQPPTRSLLVPALLAAVTEEVVWRWGVLAGVAPRVGWGAALALSAFGFAYRHTRSNGLVAYLVLGGAFGGIFLATGRLTAAIAAHAGYNALTIVGSGR
jgi:hypothetical protein